jgi:hypothetical protein
VKTAGNNLLPYFEVGGKSYSVKMDLEGARKRKNELLAEQAQEEMSKAAS